MNNSSHTNALHQPQTNETSPTSEALQQQSSAPNASAVQKLYTLKPVTKTPKALTSQKISSSDANAVETFVRAENEDDDGYDPYSDYHPRAKFFEENPWD